MTAYTCKRCNTQWDSGFFNNALCPKCDGKVMPGIWRFIKFLAKWLAFFGALTALAAWLTHPSLNNEAQALSFVQRLYNFPELFVSGPDTYIAELSAPPMAPGLYRVPQARPAYARPLSEAELGKATPLFNLKAGQVVEGESVHQGARHAWLKAGVRKANERVQIYIPLPANWRENLELFDMQAYRRTQIGAFIHDLEQRMEVKRVPTGTASRKFSSSNPMWSEIGTTDGRTLFVRKDQMAQVEQVRNRYFGNEAIASVVTQMDPGYVRPPLSTR